MLNNQMVIEFQKGIQYVHGFYMFLLMTNLIDMNGFFGVHGS